MNEQAIKDMYGLAQANGYGKSIDEFKTLLQTNEEAVSDMHGIVQKNGYSKNISSFQELVGFKKKVDSELGSVESSADGSVDATAVKKAPEVEEDLVRGQRKFGANKEAGYLAGLWQSVQAGQAKVATVDPTKDIFGKTTEEIDPVQMQEFIKHAENLRNTPVTKELQRFYEDAEKAGGGYMGILSQLPKNLSIIPQLALDTFVSMIPWSSEEGFSETMIAGGAAGGTIGSAGGATLGLIGGPLAPITSTTGAVAGLLKGGMSGIGGTLEVMLTYSELIQSELDKKGLEFNEENTLEILKDKDLVLKMRNQALAKGATIAVADLIFSGISGKATRTVKETVKNARAANVLAAGAGLTVEAIGGSTGEAAALAASGQEINEMDVILEGFGELGPGSLNVAFDILKSPQYQINGDKVSQKIFEETVETSAPKELAAMNLSIKNDDRLKGIMDAKRDVAIVENNISESVTDPEDRRKLIDLEVKRKSLVGKTGKSAKNELEILDQAITNITDKYSSPDTNEALKEVPMYSIDGVNMDREKTMAAINEAETLDELGDISVSNDPETESLLEKKGIKLGAKPKENAKEQQNGPVHGQNVQDRAEGEIDSNLPEINRTGLQNRTKAVSEEITEQTLLQQMTGKPVTVKVGGKNVSGIIDVDEEGKVTLNKGKEVFELDPDTEFTEFQRPVAVDTEGNFEYKGEKFPEARIVTEEGKKKADFIRSDKSVVAVTNPDIVEEVDYQISLANTETVNQKVGETQIPVTSSPGIAETVAKSLDAAAKTLSVAFPEVSLVVGENLQDTRAKLESALTPIVGSDKAKAIASGFNNDRGSAVFVGGKPVAVAVNKEVADATTAPHEIWHMVLREAFGKDPRKFQEFRDAIANELINNGFEDVAAYLDDFSLDYEGDVSFEEYLAELGAQLTSGGIDLSSLSPSEKTLIERIKDLINRFSKAITGVEVFLNDATPENILQFMINVSKMIEQGEDVSKVIRERKPTDEGIQMVKQKQLPARIDAEINEIIEKGKAEGKKPGEIAKEALRYVRDTDAFAKLGDRDKAKVIGNTKRLSGMRVQVKTDEYAALKDQIKLEARAAREAAGSQRQALANIAGSVRQQVKAGKISQHRAAAIVKKIAGTNLFSDVSIDSTLDYISEIFDKSNLSFKIDAAKNLLIGAKRAINTKIGQAKELYPVLKKLFSVDPSMIPIDHLDDYLSIVQDFGAKKNILTLAEAGEYMAKAQGIINAIADEQKRISNDIDSINEAEEKKRVGSIKKILETDIDVSDIQDQAILDDYAEIKSLSEDDLKATVKTDSKGLKDYSVVDKKLKRLRQIQAEAKGRQALKEVLSESGSLNLGRINDKDDLGIAKAFKGIKRAVLEKLASKEKNGMNDYSNIRKIQGVIHNLKNGYVGPQAAILSAEIEAVKRSGPVISLIPGKDHAKIILGVTRAIGKLKSVFTGRTSTVEQIRSTMIEVIDDVFGNFNSKTIFNAIFEPIYSMKGRLDADMQLLGAKLHAAERLFSKGILTSDNDAVKRKYRAMIYSLQREFEANQGDPTVSSAIEIIDKILQEERANNLKLGSIDIKIITDIRSEFSKKDGEGKDYISIEKIEKSFTNDDKKAIKLIDEVYRYLAPKALFTSAVIRGNQASLYNLYVHHQVIGGTAASRLSSIEERLLAPINPKASTKAGNLLERTPNAKAISLDPVSSAYEAMKMTLTDYYMTQQARETSKTVNRIKQEIVNNPDSTKFQIELTDALVRIFEEVFAKTFQNSFRERSIFEKGLLEAAKLGYQLMLASIPRAGAELLSNTIYVLKNPVIFTKGVSRYSKMSMSGNGLEFMKNIGSGESAKLFGNEMLIGKYADQGWLASMSATEPSKAKNRVMNTASLIYGLTLKNVKNVTDIIAQTLIPFPDTVIARPFYFGAFATEFENRTGIELKNSDLEAIADGTSEYLSEKYTEDIKSARMNADTHVARMSSSGNSFNSIIKNIPSKEDSPQMAVYRAANSFMSKFYLTEFAVGRSASLSLLKSGNMSKLGAVMTIGAIGARMSSYLVLLMIFNNMFDSLIADIFDLEGPEEMDEDDLVQLVQRASVGAAVNTITRRSLGNIPYMGIGMAVEYANDKYGGALRDDDDYDAYEHSLVMTGINNDDVAKSGAVEIGWKAMAGPYGPITKSIERGVTLGKRYHSPTAKKETKDRIIEEATTRGAIELSGNIGFLPLYKDIRRIVINDMFSDMDDKKKKAPRITLKAIEEMRKIDPSAARDMEQAYKMNK